MSIQCSTILAAMEEWAPLEWAEEWDNPGLQVGRKDQSVKKVLLALTPSQQVVETACMGGYDLLLTHHPLIFRGIKSITDQTVLGKMLLQLIEKQVAVAAYHTNLDIAPNGVNDALAEALGLQEISDFVPMGQQVCDKLVVYVPDGHVETVREAICAAGGGSIGKYCDCTYRTKGIGTFLPQEGTDPFIGQVGVLTETVEYRLETIVPHDKLAAVLTAMKRVHPYEEIAYDVFRLEGIGQKRSIGRIGQLPEKMTMERFLKRIAQATGQTNFSYSGNLHKMVQKVALCGGSAASYAKEAKRAGADVYLTADVKFHDYQAAEEDDIALIDGGHFYTERLILPRIADYLDQRFGEAVSVDIFEEGDFLKHFQATEK